MLCYGWTVGRVEYRSGTTGYGGITSNFLKIEIIEGYYGRHSILCVSIRDALNNPLNMNNFMNLLLKPKLVIFIICFL